MEVKKHTAGQIKTTSNNKCGVIYISGEFAFNTQSEFRKAYENLVLKNTLIQIDFQNTQYMDSSGLGMLLVMKKFLDDKKVVCELLKVNGQVYELLNMTHFYKYFKINGKAIAQH